MPIPSLHTGFVLEPMMLSWATDLSSKSQWSVNARPSHRSSDHATCDCAEVFFCDGACLSGVRHLRPWRLFLNPDSHIQANGHARSAVVFVGVVTMAKL